MIIYTYFVTLISNILIHIKDVFAQTDIQNMIITFTGQYLAIGLFCLVLFIVPAFFYHLSKRR